MIKSIKRMVVGTLIICVFLWGGLRVFEMILIERVPMVMANFSSPFFSVSAQEVVSGDCHWRACITAKNVRLEFMNKEAVSMGDIRLSISPIHPASIEIKTSEDGSWLIDAGLSKEAWQIRRAVGAIGAFQFETSGFIDGKNNQGELFVQTKGLRSFLSRFIEIPTWMAFLIRDTQQQIILSPKDGMLNLYGIPLIPITGY